ncbi:MAG: exonuclease domain-containing protein [Candidatus Eisenbacteria bacterium]
MLNLDLPVRAAAFTILDVETTGLEPEARITEVAAVRLARFEEVSRFESLVNPDIHIPHLATTVSGIDDALVSGAPPFSQVWPILDAMLIDSVAVAHNAAFDLHFLSAERKRAGLGSWKGPVLDTLRLARNVCVLPSYSLSALHESLHLQFAPAHRALADVLATEALLRELISRLNGRVATLGDLLAAQEPIPVAWEEIAAAGLAPDIAEGLTEASRAGHAVFIDYEGHTGPRTFRIIPRRLERNGSLYYLCGVAEERPGDRMVFRADRIRGVHAAQRG